LGAGTGGCTGDATVPTAPAEVLCVYTAGEEHPHTINALEARQPPGEFKGYGKAGAFLAGLHFEGTAATPARAEFHGTWAVTAP
jgi:hypothetical protein